MVSINSKKATALLAVICSVYFIFNRSINYLDILNSYGFFRNVSVLVTVISISIFAIGNLLTFLEKSLHLRKLMFLISAVLFVVVLVLSNFNYNTPFNSPIYLRIIFGLFNVSIIYYLIDRSKINFAYILVVVLLFVVFLMIGREAQNSFNSNLSYSIGFIGTLLFTQISAWIEVKE